MHQFRALARNWCVLAMWLQVYEHSKSVNGEKIDNPCVKRACPSVKDSTESVQKHEIGASQFDIGVLLFNCKLWRGEEKCAGVKKAMESGSPLKEKKPLRDDTI